MGEVSLYFETVSLNIVVHDMINSLQGPTLLKIKDKLKWMAKFVKT